ncbi:hypothetical protein CHUAL_012619 [Chamberlinius hualienensis]
MYFNMLTVLAFFIFVSTSSAFYNPILTKGQDPSVKFYDGNYYLTQSVSDAIIVVMKSSRLENLGFPDENVTVWTGSGQLCCEVWAPELVYVNVTSLWYIYFTADDGNNINHRAYVLQSIGTDPLGPYNFIGKIAAATDYWAIDSTVLQLNNQLYFLWSGSPNANDIPQQNIYIASMSDPTTLSSDRYLLSEPTYQWEKDAGGYGCNEGPAVWQVNGTTYVVFSASSTWENTYCLGLLTYIGGDPLQQSSWTKRNSSIFSQNPAESVFGPGHNSFTTSPDYTQWWNVYHAFEESGVPNRNVRTQVVNWNVDGTPNLGIPVGYNDFVDPPSGE